MLFVQQNIVTFCNDGRNGISLAHQKNIFYTIPLRLRLIILFPKRFFQILVNDVRPATIKCPIMIKLTFSSLTWKQLLWWILSQLKSLWRNWDHNRSVIKYININQYQSKIMKLELHQNLIKARDCN